MSGSMSYIDCPICGYEYTTEYVDWKFAEVYNFCQRCGYQRAIEGERADWVPLVLGNPSGIEFTDDFPRLTRDEESGGYGVLFWEMKEGEGEEEPSYGSNDPEPETPPLDKPHRAPVTKFGYAPVQQVYLDKIKALDKYEYLEFSFEVRGKWFLKDFVTGKQRPYDKPCYN